MTRMIEIILDDRLNHFRSKEDESSGNAAAPVGVDTLAPMIEETIERGQAEQVAWQAKHDAGQAGEQAMRYSVVSDRYANGLCTGTLAEFYTAVEDLGWDKPDLEWHPGDDTYWENGEMILCPLT